MKVIIFFYIQETFCYETQIRWLEMNFPFFSVLQASIWALSSFKNTVQI